MKQLELLFSDEVFSGSDIVQRFTFKTMGVWDKSALLAVFNHHLAASFALSWDKSAQMRKQDCFECLSPHNIAA